MRPVSCQLLTLGVVCLMASVAAQTTDSSVDVCPVNARFKTLPFLKFAKPGAVTILLSSGTSTVTIDMAKVTDFAKTTLVPMIGANVVFLVLALLFLLIFILWRLLRWCCCIVCCKGSCDAKRQKRDPYVLLFGKSTKVLKGVMLLFGLVAIAFAIYGLASVDKNVTDKFFGVLVTIVTYIERVFGKLDNLLGTVSGVNGIIDDFQAIVNNQINVTGFNYYLTEVGTFLNAIPQPANVSTAITNLNTLVNTDLVAGLASLSTALATGFANDGTTMSNGMSNIRSAYSDISSGGSSIKTLVANINTEINNIPVGTWGNPAVPVVGTVTTLKAAVDAAYTAATHATTGWLILLNGLSNALDNSVGTSNPFSKLLAKIDAVQTKSNQARTDAPALAASITSMDTQYKTSGRASISWLLNHLQYVDAEVIQLNGGMRTAYDTLSNSSRQLVTFFNNTPTPSALAANLTSFSNGLPATSSLTPLSTDLTTAQSALFADFAPSDTLAYKTWLAGIIASVNNLLTATTATGPLGALQSAIAAFQLSQSSANWDALRNTAKPACAAVVTTLLDASHLGSPVLTAAVAPDGQVQRYSTKASVAPYNPYTLNMATFSANMATANAFVSQTQAQVTNGMPNMASTLGNVNNVAASFTALGSPPSQVIISPRQQLADIQSSAITTGNRVKNQITSAVSGFRSSTSNIKAQVVGQATSLQTSYQAPARQYDGYRYIGAMVLFGISVLFVLCVLASAACNYHFGANISTLWLLLVTVLYLLLALLMAAVVSVLFLGCNELEPLAVQFAPATFTPLLRYYFYNEGTNVNAVLKSANLVDVDSLLADVTRSQSDVTSTLTRQFTFRPGPLAVIGRINTTILNVTADFNGLLSMASREELLPVYSEVKGFVCCAVPDVFGSMWMGLTFAGVFAFALIFCTFIYIGRIDKAPRKDCCGCTCHTHSKYAGTVAPADKLPQYNTPGLDPLGPYEAAFPMEMPAGWSQGDEGVTHVSVNRPAGTDKVHYQ